jgi:hypothetical protein
MIAEIDFITNQIPTDSGDMDTYSSIGCSFDYVLNGEIKQVYIGGLQNEHMQLPLIGMKNEIRDGDPPAFLKEADLFTETNANGDAVLAMYVGSKNNTLLRLPSGQTKYKHIINFTGDSDITASYRFIMEITTDSEIPMTYNDVVSWLNSSGFTDSTKLYPLSAGIEDHNNLCFVYGVMQAVTPTTMRIYYAGVGTPTLTFDFNSASYTQNWTDTVIQG